jgi:hypothetical protein
VSTVVAGWTKLIVDYAAARGLDVRRPDVDLSRPDERIPAVVDDEIWAAAVARLGDDVGLQLAETAVSVESFGVLGYLLRSSANVGEALVRMQQYPRLIKSHARIDLLWSPAGVTVVECPESARWSRPVAECILANYVQRRARGPASACARARSASSTHGRARRASSTASSSARSGSAPARTR